MSTPPTPATVAFMVNGGVRAFTIPGRAVAPAFAGMANLLGAQGNTSSTYILEAADSGLPNSRTLAAGSNITITDGGPGGNLTIAASGTIAAADTFARKIAVGALALGRH